MQNYTIGLSGINAAQEAISVIGNNIANAATEGYHRQRVELVPASASSSNLAQSGGGVDVGNVTRMIDRLLELEILRQQSSLGQVSQELSTLSTIEDTLGELSAGNALSTTIDDFFTALRDLSAHPSEVVWQNQAVTAGETLAGQVRTLGESFEELRRTMSLEAEDIVERMNALIGQIAELNGNIQKLEINGGEASNLRDQRDQRIAELAQFVAVETTSQEYGVVDVSIAGIPVVTGSLVMELGLGTDDNGNLGIAPSGSRDYRTTIQGGQLGGLLVLNNELVREISSDLDALAQAIIRQINAYHVQGVGSEGSFTELTGWVVPSEQINDLGSIVNNGKLYIRVINTETGEISRHEVKINVTQEPPDSLTTIAAKIDEIDGLNASVVSSSLHIEAQAGYKFDFLPAVLPESTASNFSAVLPPSVAVSGIYTGTENETFTLRVLGSGSVGNGSLRLEVTNGSGEVVTTLNIGDGYAAGDKLDLGNGIKIAVSTGDLNENDSFTIESFANTDTAGVLAALGINTFFSGNGAADIAVCSDIIDSPGRIATALGPELVDNANALRLAGIREETVEDLDSMTPGEFYRQLVTDVGQQVSSRQARSDNIEAMIQNLSKRQSDLSGVNVNDEAAQLLIFEQMFKTMAKYMSTIQSTMAALMEML
jgi:flagellar hook-associated protein 1 FlgK